MKALRFRIRDAARRMGIAQPVVEKDYALSYMLAAISVSPVTGEGLVFKGGTALKKLFFGDYRFSEDLDFSSLETPTGDELQETLTAAVSLAGRLMSEHGPFGVQMERYLERDPHPHGQEAFTVRIQFPWHPSPLCRIKLEITHDEPVLLSPERRPLIHGYDETLAADILCYPLDEIIAEKLRGILQTHRRLADRGWARPRVRDYYDLWRIRSEFGDTLNRPRIRNLLDEKCAHRGVRYSDENDFFSEALVTAALTQWDAALRPFVGDLPECAIVMDNLRGFLHEVLST